jgi:rhodanese-related sulfurtransferase
MSTLKTISPEFAAQLMRDGAVLVDVREADEHARERIPGARHHALSRLDAEHPARPGDDILIFHCRSGARTQAHAPRLAGSGECETYILEGGIDAWKKAGLPVALDRRQPIELMRQVQIAAGSLALAGVVLGWLVAPEFYLLSGFVGAGLTLAGVTGFCGMARLLALMPWNRRAFAAA